MAWDRFLRPLDRFTLFSGLMLGSALLLLLPHDPMRFAKDLPPISLLPRLGMRDAAVTAASAAGDAIAKAVPAAEHAETLRRARELENENLALRQQVAELLTIRDRLIGLRKRGFPADGKLIPADIIGLDAAPGRDSLLLNKGSGAGVSREDWVASRFFVNAGEADGAADTAAVIMGEALIGWIEETGRWTSRVVLLSDPVANKALKVRIIGKDNRYVEVVLSGAGRGRMKIADLPVDWVSGARARVAVGDVVTSSPDDSRLPVALAIGTISELIPNREKPLYYDAMVAPRENPAGFHDVLIADLSPTAGKE